MLKRLHIIGGPGSGKSYAARRISAALGIPAHDLDDLFWDPQATKYDTKTSPESRDRQLTEILQRDTWIIEGVYYHWLYDSFAQADQICILVPNVLKRDWRILMRFAKRKLGMGTSKKEGLGDLVNLVRWNHKYDEDNLARAREFFQEFKHKTICFKNADALVTYATESASCE